MSYNDNFDIDDEDNSEEDLYNTQTSFSDNEISEKSPVDFVQKRRKIEEMLIEKQFQKLYGDPLLDDEIT